MLFKLYKNYEKTKIIYLILKFLSSIINNYKKLTLMNIISKFILKYLVFMKGKREFSFYIFVQTWQEWYKAGGNPVKV